MPPGLAGEEAGKLVVVVDREGEAGRGTWRNEAALSITGASGYLSRR